MKIEKLRKNHKKEIIIGAVITVCLISAITLVTTRAKYRVTQDIKLAKGTVNYKPYDFKIMAMYQQNDSGTYTEINEMPTNGYVVNESKSYCTTDNKTQVKGKIKTENGNHVISNLKKNDKCYVWFDKKTPSNVTELIAAVNPKMTSPIFTNAATTDEGVYSASDGMYGGTSYYWRGASTTNHVVFANKCWRIVRINGDGTIRLIYNGAVSNGTCAGNGTNSGSIVTSQAYNSSSDRSEYVGWTYNTYSQRTTGGTSSNIKSQTDTWYNNNIGNNTIYSSKVADGKFCNDRNTASGYSWSSQPSYEFYYAGYDRSGAKSATSVTPTLSCSNAGDVYTLKAGAITMDEVVMAGGKWRTANSNYYLYNGKYYWTMSPYCWWYSSSSSRHALVFYVSDTGQLWDCEVFWDTWSIRPVINLKSDTTFATGGEGTQNNPYVVS